MPCSEGIPIAMESQELGMMSPELVRRISFVGSVQAVTNERVKTTGATE